MAYYIFRKAVNMLMFYNGLLLTCNGAWNFFSPNSYEAYFTIIAWERILPMLAIRKIWF